MTSKPLIPRFFLVFMLVFWLVLFGIVFGATRAEQRRCQPLLAAAKNAADSATIAVLSKCTKVLPGRP